MLRQIHRILKHDGHLICQFYWQDQPAVHPLKEWLKKLAASLTSGYRDYEQGDFLRSGAEFLHGFQSKKDLFREFVESGFQERATIIFQNGFFGGSLLTKANTPE
jgi:ubiquinone/menaquinone biosynthesis C-methylase UbiE